MAAQASSELTAQAAAQSASANNQPASQPDQAIKGIQSISKA